MFCSINPSGSEVINEHEDEVVAAFLDNVADTSLNEASNYIGVKLGEYIGIMENKMEIIISVFRGHPLE